MTAQTDMQSLAEQELEIWRAFHESKISETFCVRWNGYFCQSYQTCNLIGNGWSNKVQNGTILAQEDDKKEILWKWNHGNFCFNWLDWKQWRLNLQKLSFCSGKFLFDPCIRLTFQPVKPKILAKRLVPTEWINIRSQLFKGRITLSAG